jgi:hypothetical protein
VIQEDFMKAARKIKETKKLESKLNYTPVWFDNGLKLFSIDNHKFPRSSCSASIASNSALKFPAPKP